MIAVPSSGCSNGTRIDEPLQAATAKAHDWQRLDCPDINELPSDGVATAVLQRLAPLGVYDADTFSRFLFSDPRLHQRFVESTRDLMSSNSTKGFKGLTEEDVLIFTRN
ncbi:hypothetical protein [Tabrizicola sp.]|uniref:hypothetical protein n=1 Tax=Tabrizicola sp. TaxID=2005166 RepID=UPI00261C4078|nr:hypothetical protein [Tabrizicola sp.]MDM7930942.1 hypothetical protein [Tabrizicola sp.]